MKTRGHACFPCWCPLITYSNRDSKRCTYTQNWRRTVVPSRKCKIIILHLVSERHLSHEEVPPSQLRDFSKSLKNFWEIFQSLSKNYWETFQNLSMRDFSKSLTSERLFINFQSLSMHKSCCVFKKLYFPKIYMINKRLTSTWVASHELRSIVIS